MTGERRLSISLNTALSDTVVEKFWSKAFPLIDFIRASLHDYVRQF